MELTAFALVALICTQNNLVCRDAADGTKTYETEKSCHDGLDRISPMTIPEGYKLVSRCVPVSVQNDVAPKYEWALSWAGEPAAYAEPAAHKTVVADAGTKQRDIAATDDFLSVAQVSQAASGRVLTTLNAVASVE